ncbi:CGNR zinc finger domain-containing protein [Streptomyces corynorhini]|uniref:CGNR zinc finger domain-containing protein n=1 Tax=Streptomyces corynorhini TaxID=2282652 RepID=UPI001F4816FC|nr:CGNR zinc finger domain-containing protein [Streptomyces corynorhini]
MSCGPSPIPATTTAAVRSTGPPAAASVRARARASAPHHTTVSGRGRRGRRASTALAASATEGAARALNGLLRRTAGAVRLTSHHGTSPWHPHLDSDDEAPWGEWFLASSCLALTVLVWDRQRPPGGLCTSPSCTDVYLTQSGGPPRRYCSRRCATRERVAAHRRSRS